MTSSSQHNRNLIAIPALVLVCAALAGCDTIVPYPSAPQTATPDLPMTHSRAAAECWMSTEKGRANMNLDRRADIVTKCIDDKMKAARAAPAR
jgi:hypothetical protein